MNIMKTLHTIECFHHRWWKQLSLSYALLLLAFLLLSSTSRAQNNALNFPLDNATSSLVIIPDHPKLGFTYFDPGTIEMWIRIPEGYYSTHILSKRYYNSSILNYQIAYIKDVGIELNNGLYTMNSYYIPPAGEWTHIAYTYTYISATNSGIINMYVNGCPYTSWNGKMFYFSNSSPLTLGNLESPEYGLPGDPGYKGGLDEVRIWRECRTAEQIEANFNISINPELHPGLAAYYKMDQGEANGINTSINTLYDATSNNLHGTIYGFPMTGMDGNFVDGWTYNGSGCCDLNVDAGSDEDTYYGLALDQTVMRTPIITGGTEPYLVSWTMNRPILCDVITLAGDEVFQATDCIDNVCSGTEVPPFCTGNVLTTQLIDTAIIYVTVTDANGCIAMDSFTVNAEDVRCFPGASDVVKIKVCHQTGSAKKPCVTICIDESAVEEHLAHGDFLGNCNPSCSPARESSMNVDGGILYVFPNPTNNHIIVDLEISTGIYAKAELMLFNLTGQLMQYNMAAVQDGLLVEQIQIDNNIPSGIYTLVVQVNDQEFKTQVIIQK